MLQRLGLLLAFVWSACASSAPYPASFKAVDTLMTKLAKANLFAGMASARKGDKILFQKGYGQIYPELGVKMRNNHRYHIGSNMQLMVSAVVYQQALQGTLNVTLPIDQYINWTDFGLSEPWCPQVWNDTLKAAVGDCYFPNLEQLLMHRSGFIDVGVHCRYTYGDWQWDWCFSGPNGTAVALKYQALMASGAARPQDVLSGIEYFKVPLQSVPGTDFHDVTIDTVWIAYILEKVMGKPMKAILQDNLFDMAGMTDSFYDLSNRNDGVYYNHLPLPGYYAHVSPLSFSMYNLDFPAIGNLSVQSGDVISDLDPEGPPYGTFRKYARLAIGADPSWIPLVNAAGAIVSSPRDMHAFMRTLTRNPGALGLDNATVRHMLTTGLPSNPPPSQLYFVQGTVTYPVGDALNTPLGTKLIFYQGNMGYSATHYYEMPDPSDPSQDVYLQFVQYAKPIIDGFNLQTVKSNASQHGNPDDPLSPNNGTTICKASVRDIATDTALQLDFLPQFGVLGAAPTRDRAAWEYFLAWHKERDTPVSKGPVDVPHVLCDSKGQLDYYLMGKLSVAALGRAWFSGVVGPHP